LAALLCARGRCDSLDQLPSAKDSTNEFFLTARNFAAYQDYLLEPFASWLKEGKYVMRLAADIGFAWRYSSKWQAQSLKNYRASIPI